VNTGQATSKAELIILSTILQVSAAAAQFSDSPLGEGGPITPTNLETLIITPINFLAPGIDVTTWTGAFLFLSILGVLSLSNYSFIRTVFMVIDARITSALSPSNTAFDNWKVAAGLSVLVAYISTYSLGILFSFTLSGIAGAGTVLILFFVTLGVGAFVVYKSAGGGGGGATPDGGYVDTDGEVAQTVADATERISAAKNEDPQRALVDEREALDEIEEVEDHLSDVLDQEQDRITELLQQLEQVIETDEDEQEHLESIQEYLDQIEGALKTIESGDHDDSDFETIGEAYVRINELSTEVASLEESDYSYIEYVVEDAENALDDIKEISGDVTQIRRDLKSAEAVNSDLKSGLSEKLSQNLEIDETEREDAMEKASSLLQMQSQLVQQLDSKLGSLINKDSQAAGSIEDAIEIKLSEESELVQLMKSLSERDSLNQDQKAVLRQGSKILSESMKTLSNVEEMRRQSDEYISSLEQKLNQIEESVYN
jgi:hypothetical protein